MDRSILNPSSFPELSDHVRSIREEEADWTLRLPGGARAPGVGVGVGALVAVSVGVRVGVGVGVGVGVLVAVSAGVRVGVGVGVARPSFLSRICTFWQV